jgi:hypothetical protein
MGNLDRLRSLLAAAVAFSLLIPSAPVSALPIARPGGKVPIQAALKTGLEAGQLQGDERIVHALNRLTFGPQPGDLEAVRALGLDKWFTQQLHPSTIDNSVLEARLAEFPAMQLSPANLLNRLPSNGIIRQVIDGKLPVPPNGAERAIYTNEIARYEMRQQQKEFAKRQQASLNAVPATPGPKTNGSSMADQTAMPADRPQRAAEPQMIDETRMSPSSTAQEPPAPSDADIARVLAMPAAAERLTRDIYSNSQLQEVMTDFWLNHFNVYLHKNDETPYYL